MVVELLTTNQIIEEIRLERELRRLPHEVHHVVYRWVLNKTLRSVDESLVTKYLTLTDAQRALVAAHTKYREFADRKAAQWIASVALSLNASIAQQLLLGLVVFVYDARELDPAFQLPSGWPSFLGYLLRSGESHESDFQSGSANEEPP